MKKFSVTQAGNYAAMLGFLLQLAGVKVGGLEELTQVVTSLMVLGGLTASWYGRWKKGDLYLSGFKKY